MTNEQKIQAWGIEKFNQRQAKKLARQKNNYQKNIDKRKEYQNQYYQGHKDQYKQYRLEHRDELLAHMRQYNLEHRKETTDRIRKNQKSARDYLKFFYSNENYNGYQEIHTHFQFPQLDLLIKEDPITKLSTKNYRYEHCNCEICGKPTECVHHKIPKAQYYRDLRDTLDMNHIDILRKINSEDNLIALCNSCHKLIHRGELNDDEL